MRRGVLYLEYWRGEQGCALFYGIFREVSILKCSFLKFNNINLNIPICVPKVPYWIPGGEEAT